MREPSLFRSSNHSSAEEASSQIITYRRTACRPDFASIRPSQTHSQDFFFFFLFQALSPRTPKLPEIYGVKLGQKNIV